MFTGKIMEIITRQANGKKIVFWFFGVLATAMLAACHPCQITNCGPEVLPISVSIGNDGEIYMHILSKNSEAQFELESISITKENEPYPQASYFSSFNKHRGPPQKIITSSTPIKYGELYPNQKQEFGPKKIINGIYKIRATLYTENKDFRTNEILAKGKFSFENGKIKNIK